MRQLHQFSSPSPDIHFFCNRSHTPSFFLLRCGCCLLYLSFHLSLLQSHGFNLIRPSSSTVPCWVFFSHQHSSHSFPSHQHSPHSFPLHSQESQIAHSPHHNRIHQIPHFVEFKPWFCQKYTTDSWPHIQLVFFSMPLVQTFLFFRLVVDGICVTSVYP